MINVALFLAAVVSAGPTKLAPTGPPVPEPPPSQSSFKCADGGGLTAKFTSAGAQLVAIVDAGDGPHALPIRPWDGGAPIITWSDGKRTLTWSPGVQIMWMDGATHRMCGRSGGHKH